MPQSKQTKRAKALKYLDARLVQLETVMDSYLRKDMPRYSELQSQYAAALQNRTSLITALGSGDRIDHRAVNAYVPQLSPIY